MPAAPHFPPPGFSINGKTGPMKKPVLTLRRVIALVVIIGLFVPALLINGSNWFQTYRAEIRDRTAELATEHAAALADNLSGPLWNLDRKTLIASINAALEHDNDIVRIEVRDNKRTVLASGQRTERHAEPVATADSNVYFRNQPTGSLTVEVNGRRLHVALMDTLRHQVLILAAQLGLSLALILLLLERLLIRPLQDLTANARLLAKRQADATPASNSSQRTDEIGLLARYLEQTRIHLQTFLAQEKQVQAPSLRHEAHLLTLMEQSPIAIIEWDMHHQVIEWNPAAQRIFGYRREQVLGRHARFLVPHNQQIGFSVENMPNLRHNLTAAGDTILCEWRDTAIGTGTLSLVEDVTEKRRASEVQRLSEIKFEGAFRCNPDSVSIVRASDGNFIEVNDAFERITGFSRSEWLGRNAQQLHIWLFPEERAELLRQLEQDVTVQDFPWSMRNKAGEIRSCLANATLFSVDGEKYMLAVIRDVTDQRLLEEQKAEADHALLRLAQGTQGLAGESFFELLVADLASALRTDSVFIGLIAPNDPARMHMLASHSHAYAADLPDYAITNAPCERVMAGQLCIFASGVQASFPQYATLKEQGWESYAGAPLHDATGRVIGVLAVMHSKPLRNPDLVRSLLQVFSERASAELERKRAEGELRLSEQRFATIFHSTPVAMYVTQISSDSVVKDVNSAFEQLFMQSRDSVIGRNTHDLEMYCNPADREALLAELESTGGIRHHTEIWMFRGDRSKILIQYSGHVFLLEGEQYGIFACQDITEKRRIENEIRELNATLEDRVVERTDELQQANQELETTLDALNLAHEELVNSEKLAALGALVAGISHELNTPIGNSLMVASTLTDQTEALSGSYRDQNGIKRSVLENYIADVGKAGDILVRNLHRAADLVNSFKQVAIDQTSSQRRTFSLAEVTGEILLTLWPVIRKSPFNVEQNIPDDLTFDSYPGPLGQVLTNLINNALLHGFEGRSQGVVVIAARASDMDGWVELTIKDDGIGIPAVNLNRIFDPFFTTKLGEGGSGLGLNITHNIVSGVLGGRVRVQSAIGVGTTFTLLLPLVAPQRKNENQALHTE